MPRFQVRLTKTVTDTLDAYFEVEAENAKAAADMALELEAEGEADWQFAYADETGGTPIEIDDVTEIKGS
jgi:hypothetical protein